MFSFNPQMEGLEDSHADLRWRTTAANRTRKQKQKYYDYRGVLPSWVGQQYYDLTVVSHEPISWKKSKKTPKHQFKPTTFIEQEHSQGSNLFKQSTIFSPNFWLESLIRSYIDLAIKEANRLPQPSGSPTYSLLTPSYTPVTTTFSAPETLTALTTSIRPTFPQPTTLPPNTPLHLKLKLRTWTKHDNFTHKTHFRSFGADVRHSRGKRRVREKHLQKWNERDLQRNMKARTRVLHDAAEEAWNEQCCDGLHGSVFRSDDDDYAHMSASWYRWGCWADDIFDRYCDIPWRQTCWGRKALEDSAADSREGNNWWAWEEEDEKVVLVPGDEGWTENPVSLVVAVPLDAFFVLGSRKREQRAWRLARRAGCMALFGEDLSDAGECGSVDEGFWVELARSLHSSDIVCGGEGSTVSDGDFDAMSDVAEAIVEMEWDLVSESSEISST